MWLSRRFGIGFPGGLGLCGLCDFGWLGGSRSGGFGGFVFHGLLAGELDAALVVDGDDLDADRLAHLHFFADGFEEAIGELGNVAEAVLAGDDFDEGAEILDAGDLAVVDFADLDVFGEAFDFFAGLLGGFHAHGGDEY